MNPKCRNRLASLILTVMLFSACKEKDPYESDIFDGQSYFGNCKHDITYQEPVIPNGIYWPDGDETAPYYLEITENKYLQYKAVDENTLSMRQIAEQTYAEKVEMYEKMGLGTNFNKETYFNNFLVYAEKTEFKVITLHAFDAVAIYTEWKDFERENENAYIGEKYTGTKVFKDVYVQDDGSIKIRGFYAN